MNTLLKVIITVLLIFPVTASAATAVVSVDTGKESINALEGTLLLPANVSVRDIQNGNSMILMWLTPPTHTRDTVTFSGITPGGFSGTYPVFTISGEFTPQDLEQMRFESVVALKDDGLGTQVPVEMQILPGESKIDTAPPEDFVPVIAQDSKLFGGKHFLSFATQDKGSGIARYEVREGRWWWFEEAESPYLLANQKLNKTIYVKAVDEAGNERIVSIAPVNPPSWYENFLLWLILTSIVLGVWYVLRLWQKRK